MAFTCSAASSSLVTRYILKSGRRSQGPHAGMIVGAMIERVGGKTWDELITERIFVPLGLRSAGLGPQATLGKIDAPLGHLVVGDKTKAFLAGPSGDNPLIIGPAGIAHMSVLDFAR